MSHVFVIKYLTLYLSTKTNVQDHVPSLREITVGQLTTPQDINHDISLREKWLHLFRPVPSQTI